LAYKSLIVDDAQVPDTFINLLSKGPSFSPTPLDPPDLAELEEDLLDWRERMRWAFFHRSIQLLGNGALSQETPFSKFPWYKRSSNPAPAASEDIEMFIQLVRK
jgi:hypothetical protein